jgi:hypothetical protein
LLSATDQRGFHLLPFNRRPQDAGDRLEEMDVVTGKRPLLGGVDPQHIERPGCVADDRAHTAYDIVIA